MEMNLNKLNRKLVKDLLKAFLDPKHPAYKHFLCLARVHQAPTAADNNIRGVDAVLAKDPEHKYTKFDCSWEAYRGEMPESLEEYQQQLQYLIALDAAIRAYGKPVEEEFIQASEIDKGLEDRVSTFTRKIKPEKYVYKIGKGVFCLDLGDFVEGHEGEFIIGPFCESNYSSEIGSSVITENTTRPGYRTVDEKKYGEFLDDIDAQQYEDEKGNDSRLGDYQKVYGDPLLRSAQTHKNSATITAEAIMDMAKREIIEVRKRIAIARANGEFDDKPVEEGEVEI
jgi:hypothetical protein